MLRTLKHPHIVPLVDPLRYDNRVVKVTKIVVEAMDTSLQAWMMKGQKRNHLDPTTDRLEENMARKIFYAVSLALDYLHHKLAVHLDVKLDNILLGLDGDGNIRKEADGRLVVKIADFGLAFYLGGDGDECAKFPSSGTCKYIAPEVSSHTSSSSSSSSSSSGGAYGKQGT